MKQARRVLEKDLKLAAKELDKPEMKSAVSSLVDKVGMFMMPVKFVVLNWDHTCVSVGNDVLASGFGSAA